MLESLSPRVLDSRRRRLRRALANDEFRAQHLKRRLRGFAIYEAQEHCYASFALTGKIMANGAQRGLKELRLWQIIVTNYRNMLASRNILGLHCRR